MFGSNRNLVYIAIALAAIYLFWGGIYLATRFAVESIPSFLMAGGRFGFAGILLYAAARYRGAAVPDRRDWFNAGMVGIMLLTGGNGGVVLASKIVPSGINALMYATLPLWMVILSWLWLRSARPDWITWFAIVLGIIGIAILTGGDSLFFGGNPIYLKGALICTTGAFLWALGSIYSRKVVMPKSMVMSAALQMIVGGGAFFLLALFNGEWSQFCFGAISFRSGVSFIYLMIFGSLVALSAYVWLLQNTPPVLVSTCAFVCPVIAVVLGKFLGNEPLTWRMVLSGIIILVAVIMITLKNVPKKINIETTSSLATQKAGNITHD